MLLISSGANCFVSPLNWTARAGAAAVLSACQSVLHMVLRKFAK